MNNGRPITDPKSGYDPQNPYANRDPRLANNVIYHGKRYIYHRTFYVYYLSSGRYVADESQLYSGSTVKIVRWNGSVIYLTRNK